MHFIPVGVIKIARRLITITLASHHQYLLTHIITVCNQNLFTKSIATGIENKKKLFYQVLKVEIFTVFNTFDNHECMLVEKRRFVSNRCLQFVSNVWICALYLDDLFKKISVQEIKRMLHGDLSVKFWSSFISREGCCFISIWCYR